MGEGLSITVAVAGASGACYAQRLLQPRDASPRVRRITLLVSENGRRVVVEEFPAPPMPEVADRRPGAVIRPAMPAFYHRPRAIDDSAPHRVSRILDHLGIEHSQETMWGGGYGGQ